MLRPKRLAHTALALPRRISPHSNAFPRAASATAATRAERCLGNAMDTDRQRALWCEIVEQIQDAELYADSKHAVDLAALTPWPKLAAAWKQWKNAERSKEDLASFVDAHFGPPGRCSHTARTPQSCPLPEHFSAQSAPGSAP